MFLRFLAGSAGALLLCLSPLTAQSSGSSPSDGLHGRARGGWELPERGEAGRVRGRLLEQDGFCFALDARLAPFPGARPGGRIEGLLFPVTDQGVSTRAAAVVLGTYSAGPEGNGHFEARILALPAALPAGFERLGRLVGHFSDPRAAGPDVPGEFVGRWRLSR